MNRGILWYKTRGIICITTINIQNEFVLLIKRNIFMIYNVGAIVFRMSLHQNRIIICI